MPDSTLFDVFLSHNSKDKVAVRNLKRLLVLNGLKVWLDEDELQPGRPWQRPLEIAIRSSRSIAVLVGADELSPWADEEIQGALQLAAKDNRPIIPVVLPLGPDILPELPIFLTNRTWVILRPAITAENLGMLIWGITGSRPNVQEVQITKPPDTTGHTTTLLSRASAPLRHTGRLVDEVLQNYKCSSSNCLKSYEAFFRYFQHQPPSGSLLDHTTRTVEDFTERENLAIISGYPGTGKSALLTCIYLRQMERLRTGETNFHPVYINLRTFVLEAIQRDKDGKEVVTAFREELKSALQREDARKAKAIMLIVDGCDEYFRHPAQSLLDQELSAWPDEIEHTGKIVRIVGVGRNEKQFATARGAISLHWAKRSEVITLNRFRTDSRELPQLLEAYEKIATNPRFPDLRERMARIVREFEMKELDIFLLSLLEKAVVQEWHVGSPGIGPLYFQFCCERVRLLSEGPALTDSECRQEVHGMAKRVFATYVKGESHGESGAEAVRSRFFVASISHLHASIKEFLIAEHLVVGLESGEFGDTHLLGHTYPYGINRFLKSILNRSQSVQTQIFDTIATRYNETKIEQQTHLCYILGRFKDRGLQARAKTLLTVQLTKLKRTPHPSNDPARESYRQWLLLLRTIYISLIYLEDQRVSSQYLEELLNDSHSDDLNRGFHLEYYEDLPRAAAPTAMIAFDKLDVAPNKTFEILSEKLAQDIKANRVRQMTVIELQTLCSLCLNRHIVGLLDEDHRTRLHDLLKGVLHKQSLTLALIQQSYVEMTLDLLSRPKVSVGGIIAELLALKRVARAGWNASRLLSNGTVITRVLSNPESVADHTLGCLLIADMLLPENYSADAKYSKSAIKDMLLIHDLAEAYDGDKATFHRTEDDIRLEDARMRRLGSLGCLRALEGMKIWRALWDEFSHARTINGLIANDIDHIENYIQLLIYKESIPHENVAIPDANEWAKELIQVRTDVGKQILEKLSHSGSPVLSWYRRNSGIADNQ